MTDDHHNWVGNFRINEFTFANFNNKYVQNVQPSCSYFQPASTILSVILELQDVGQTRTTVPQVTIDLLAITYNNFWKNSTTVYFGMFIYQRIWCLLCHISLFTSNSRARKVDITHLFQQDPVQRMEAAESLDNRRYKVGLRIQKCICRVERK